MEQVLFGGYYNLLDDTATEENALLGGYDWRGVGFEYLLRKPVGSAGNLKNLRVKLDDSPGVGKKYTFTVMVNGNPSGVTLEIADAATTGNSGANTVAIVAGDLVSLQCAPDSTPTARYATWTCIFDGTTANESLILGGGGGADPSKTATRYSFVAGVVDAFHDTEDKRRLVCPTAGVIKNLYVVLNEHPGDIGVDGYRFTLRLNGATVAESPIVTITAEDTTGNDTSHNLVVVAGDILTMKIDPINEPSAIPRPEWGMTFVATTDGESIVMGANVNPLNTGATRYNYLTTALTLMSGDEIQRYHLGQSCVIKKLYILLSAAPTAGKKYTFTARVAGAGDVVVEVADAATTGNSGGLTDTVSNDEYVGLQVVPDGTPTVADACWGLVSYIAPPKTKTVAIDALLKATDTKTVAIDALLEAVGTKAINLDAFIAAVGLTKTVALDIILTAFKEAISLDALLEAVDTKTINLDAFIASVGLTKPVTLDALLEAVDTETVDLDALLQVLGITKTVALDILLGVPIKTVDLDTYILATDSVALSLDIILTAYPAGALGFTIEVRNSSDDLLAILHNAFEVGLVEEVNRPPMLDFKLPSDDSKLAFVIPDNELWLRNYKTGVLMYKFLLSRRKDVRV